MNNTDPPEETAALSDEELQAIRHRIYPPARPPAPPGLMKEIDQECGRVRREVSSMSREERDKLGDYAREIIQQGTRDTLAQRQADLKVLLAEVDRLRGEPRWD